MNRREWKLAGLPASLVNLLEQKDLRLASAREITMLPSHLPRRRVFQLQLENGQRLKGRVVRNAARARSYWFWGRQLPDGYSRLLATHQNAVLEEWVESDPPPCAVEHRPFSVAELRACGRLLGGVHRVCPLETVRRDDSRMQRLVRGASRNVQRLYQAGRLDSTAAACLVQATRDLQPHRAHWGLTHRDFCAENLVWQRAQPVCVDNPSVRPGFLELDLAKTRYRWSMLETQWMAFGQGHAMPAPWTGYFESEAFWRICVLLRSAVFRLPLGDSHLAQPLQQLQQVLSAHTPVSVERNRRETDTAFEI